MGFESFKGFFGGAEKDKGESEKDVEKRKEEELSALENSNAIEDRVEFSEDVAEDIGEMVDNENSLNENPVGYDEDILQGEPMKEPDPRLQARFEANRRMAQEEEDNKDKEDSNRDAA